MSIPQPSTTRDGNDYTKASTQTVSLIDYQCVTSHGNAVVSDGTVQTAVTYSPGKAVLKPYGSNRHGLVHIPIHNPPEVLNKTMSLQNIAVSFDTAFGGTVETVTLFYDSTIVVGVNTEKKGQFHIDFTPKEAAKFAYPVTTGICITLDLKFPEYKSLVNLFSVTLVYKAI
ncbi:hypothetical protein DCS_08211 [Drechmeria coniospora]|uniref:Uncharacterized protein n=1 Tax=Drechmeria coniospora TaxID=98403 RepID=A0A151GGT4_DRECN|nr:hypothetical protein DCS_08211 [Drechmeria coniospora]KYK56241.1 hypothetical protein DCS_08211 [Drechmeria coniospora]ODA80556.1 hypothetical protein RJ55_03515 [Drechmeria coniospora]